MDEELSKYFSTADNIQIVSSPISNHLERVRAALMGNEFPTDKAQVATLRTSLFKLAISADIPQPKRNVFYSIALQINNLFYKYRNLKELRFDDASLDIKRLEELQEKKSQFHASYLALERWRGNQF
ncbi:hypothetical protein A2U01_0049519 [Trifolium medium]|uniref:Uncharacterized protein n=1 Tax=Trifolium medium TaxID=97028 RepID=A0A392QWD6_9FABA|nr:hypothetical protein [Trifolium medium]